MIGTPMIDANGQCLRPLTMMQSSGMFWARPGPRFVFSGPGRPLQSGFEFFQSGLGFKNNPVQVFTSGLGFIFSLPSPVQISF